MARTEGTGVAEALLDALARLDYDAIARSFAQDATLRVLTPKAVREDRGRTEIEARFRRWFGDLEDPELVVAAAEPALDRTRLRFSVRGRHPERGPTATDHTAYLRVEDGLIAQMDDVCTGFRPDR